MKLAIVGLGKMGKGIAEKLLADGHEVVVWNRSQDIADAFISEHPKAKKATNIEELRTLLSGPRTIWSMIPSGEATETVMKQLVEIVEPHDLVIDGGNANFHDTERRYKVFQAKQIAYLGIGVSGGIHGLKNGFSLMAGGDKKAYETIVPILQSLSKPSGSFAYFGRGGAGHFVKMVHNGIEYGMMQAIGEGFGVLAASGYHLDLLSVAKTWQKGTIVSSFLIDCAADVLKDDPKLEHLIGSINATGEAQWTVEEAKKQNVPVPIIEESIAFRAASQTDTDIQQTVAAKMVAGLRNVFGGHDVKKKN